MILYYCSTVLGVAFFFSALFYLERREEMRWRFSSRVSARRNVAKNILGARVVYVDFPEFLDLLGLCLSAGLSIEQAWEVAARHLRPGPLKSRIHSIAQSFSMGFSREESFQELSKQINDHRLTLLFSLVAKTLKSGGQLQTLFHEQAVQLRQARLHHLEKRAQTASLRMLFPLFLFIFPTLFIVIFSPLILRLVYQGRLF